MPFGGPGEHFAGMQDDGETHYEGHPFGTMLMRVSDYHDWALVEQIPGEVLSASPFVGPVGPDESSHSGSVYRLQLREQDYWGGVRLLIDFHLR